MENENHIPETGSEQEETETTVEKITFDQLSDTMRTACEQAGWDRLMSVQELALPYLLNDRDVMVQARTGSGKTGAFVLPLLEKIDVNSPKCQALVMVPTRELAKQVTQEATMLSGENGVKAVAVYGGVGYKEQLDAFRDGAQLVVGTPGRILDHLMRRNLVLDDLRVLIFDEADRMLSVGFYPDMVEVKRYLPPRIDGSYMFSATFPPSVLRLAEEFMYKPEFLSLSSDETNVSAIAHQFVEVQAMGKERKLIKLIELENPASAVIFCNTKRNVEFTAALLSQFGFDAEGLTSDLTQNKRERLMTRIKEGKLRFLVATDVAARGIDIPELSHVFMMEPPEDPESYVHRAGRTGRAGASGTAITLVDVIQKMELERIATRFKITFEEIKDPTEEDVADIIGERLTAILEKRFRKLTNIQQERVSRFLPLARKFAEDEEALALLAMLLDEIYQPTLHGKPAEPGVANQGQQQAQQQPRQQKPKKKKPRRDEQRDTQHNNRGGRSGQSGDNQPRGNQSDDNSSRGRQNNHDNRSENRKPRPKKDNEQKPRSESKPQAPERREAAAESAPSQDEQPKRRPRRPRRRRRRKPSGS